MSKKKRISQSITLYTQELMRISMECFPKVFNEGQNSDLLFQVPAVLISYRCESSTRKYILVDRLKFHFKGIRLQEFC